MAIAWNCSARGAHGWRSSRVGRRHLPKRPHPGSRARRGSWSSSKAAMTRPGRPTNAPVTIAFGADGRLSARIDCNRGQSTWKASGSTQLELGPLALTRRLPARIHARSDCQTVELHPGLCDQGRSSFSRAHGRRRHLRVRTSASRREIARPPAPEAYRRSGRGRAFDFWHADTHAIHSNPQRAMEWQLARHLLRRRAPEPGPQRRAARRHRDG